MIAAAVDPGGLLPPPVRGAVAGPARPAAAPAAFRTLLASRLEAGAGPGPAGDGVAREAARQFVSTALIAPVLRQMHESPFDDGPLAPGPSERRFTPLLDMHLADRITRAANFTLVDAVVERLQAGRPAPASGLEGGTR